MDLIQIEGGEVLANLEERTITGLLVPYNEIGQTNIGRFLVEAGILDIPADPAVLGINTDHVRSATWGRASKAWETPQGIMASFVAAKTPEGDRALAEATDPNGKRRRLSGEFHATIRDGKAIAGRLWGAALVERGAFPSAMVLAADTPAGEDVQLVDADTDGDGSLDIAVTALPSEITATTPAGDSAVYTPEASPAEETPEGGSIVTATEVLAGAPAPAPVPPTMLGSVPSGPSSPVLAAATVDDIDLRQVFAAMGQVKQGTHMEAADALAVLAELSDIKYNASGGLTTAGNGVLQHGWVGKLWQGRRYVRKYIDLVSHFYGGIALGGRKGFTINQGTALVTHWAGNKAPIGSGTASTATKSSSLRKYAFAADVAREWNDLEGGAEVIQAFWEGVMESYALITDLDALDDIFAVAATTSVALDRLVDPGVYPTEYPDAMGMLIQGIDLVEDAGDTPSFAIVNPAARAQLRYTPKDLVPEFVSFTVAPEGRGTADGRVNVVSAPDAAFEGIDPTEPAVIVGAKSGIEFREHGQTPIQIDAVDVAKGGLDKAVVGYMETFVVRPESYVLIGTEE